MPVTFRAATFNVENLFSRAKVLNMSDGVQVDAILKDVGKLKKLLGKTTYSPADKTSIRQMVNALSAYIIIREDRGKLFTGTGSNRRVTASGAKAWDGVIEFKRASISEMARKSTADVVKALKADVVCAVEVESRPTLQDFNSTGFLGTQKFDFAMLIDGNDDRGIDVGLLSRFPLGDIRSHIYDRDSTGVVFSRDCLEVDLELSNGRTLHVLFNHLKSKGYGSQAGNDAKRRRQTVRIAQILAGYNLTSDLVIVAGDMNDVPGSGPMQPLLGVANLFDVLEVQFGNNAQQRWTYKYGSQLNQIDYLLVSKPLKDGLQQAGVERRGMHGVQNLTGQPPFPSVTSATSAASDHGSVWAEFRV